MRKAFAIIAAVLLLPACEGMHDGSGGVRGPVRFGSSFASLKSSVSDDLSQHWLQDDMVGIFGSVDGFSIGDNLPYEVDPETPGSGIARFLAVNDAIVWSGEANYAFQAYSPYNINDFGPTAVPFEIPSLLKYASAEDLSSFAAVDLVSAQATMSKDNASIGEKTDVHFSFRHAFSIVRARVSADASLSGRKIVKAVLSSEVLPLAGVKGTADITSVPAVLSLKGNAGKALTIEFQDAPSLSAAGCGLWFLCLPSGDETGDLHLSVILDDGTVCPFHYSGITLKANSVLNLNAAVGADSGYGSGTTLPVRLSLACKSTELVNAGIVGNSVCFANGARITRDDGQAVTLIGNSDNPAISSAAWSMDAAWHIRVPVSEEVYGTVRMDFKYMSRGIAGWKTEWSSDGQNWVEGNSFTLNNSSQMVSCTSYFDIPRISTVPAGGTLHVRIRPASMTPCTGGSVPYVDERSDPRLLHSVVFTPCRPLSTPAPSGAVMFCPFDDCTDGVDAVGLGARNLLGNVAMDGPLYPGSQNCWMRYGYLRLGIRGAESLFLAPAFSSAYARIKVTMDLAAYYSAAGSYDIGSVRVGVRNADTDDEKTCSSAQLSDGQWHNVGFEFNGVAAGSTLYVRSTGPRFYVDNITVTSL